MDRFQNAMNIFYLNTSDKDKLAVVYGNMIQRVQGKLLSSRLKNTNYDGIVERAGTLTVRRMRASVVRPYGTARAAGEGDALVNDGVDLKIDTDREIVEELEYKDILKYGVPNLIESRQDDHVVSMVSELEDAYFVALQTAATTVDLSMYSTPQAKILGLIQRLERVQNSWVNKVDRELMVLTLSPYWYDTLKTYMTTLANTEGMKTEYFYGVRVEVALRQTVDAVIQVRGSVAQPVSVSPYKLDNIPFSDAKSVSLFFYYGTKAIMPDLIFKGALDSDISA